MVGIFPKKWWISDKSGAHNRCNFCVWAVHLNNAKLSKYVNATVQIKNLVTGRQKLPSERDVRASLGRKSAASRQGCGCCMDGVEPYPKYLQRDLNCADLFGGKQLDNNYHEQPMRQINL